MGLYSPPLYFAAITSRSEKIKFVWEKSLQNKSCGKSCIFRSNFFFHRRNIIIEGVMAKKRVFKVIFWLSPKKWRFLVLTSQILRIRRWKKNLLLNMQNFPQLLFCKLFSQTNFIFSLLLVKNDIILKVKMQSLKKVQTLGKK